MNNKTLSLLRRLALPIDFFARRVHFNEEVIGSGDYEGGKYMDGSGAQGGKRDGAG